jgi:small subunit ribosomal protein S16
VAVKIRLKRMGKIRQPYYRVVVVDSRKKRDGKVIEEIGKYHPKEEPSFIEVKTERAQYWLGVGAQPSEAVEAILKVTGDWQKFKGLPGAEGTLKTAEPKRDKTEIFNEALKDAAAEPKAGATTSKKKAEKKAEPAEDKPAVTKSEKKDKPAEDKPEDKAEDKAETEAPAEAPAEDKADEKADDKADDKADAKADKAEEKAGDEKADA